MDNFVRAWFELMMMPLTMQTAMAASLMGTTVHVSSSFTLGAPRRRSTASLTLVASNHWVRSQRSAASLSVVPN